MKIFKTIFTFVIVCCAIDIANADILNNLEKYLSKKNVAEKDAISEALAYLDNLGALKGLSLTGVDKSFIKKGLESIRDLATWATCVKYIHRGREFMPCDYDDMAQVEPIQKLFEKLSADGILRLAIQAEIDKLFDKRGDELISIYRFKSLKVDKVGLLIEGIAEKVEGLCYETDQTEQNWKYTCIRKIRTFDAKKFTPGMWDTMLKLDKGHKLDKLMSSNITNSYLTENLVEEVHENIAQPCFAVEASAEGTVYRPDLPRNTVALAKLTSRHIDPADSEILRKLETGLHFCPFLKWYGSWEKVVAETIIAKYRKNYETL